VTPVGTPAELGTRNEPFEKKTDTDQNTPYHTTTTVNQVYAVACLRVGCKGAQPRLVDGGVVALAL